MKEVHPYEDVYKRQTCTCSNGTTTLTAPNTTGSYTFTVPSAGTWTVKSTNGTDTAQQAVSITTSGQSASVTLSYKPTASTSAKSGVNYTTGISSLTAEKMSLYAEAISRNSAITNTTSTVSYTHLDVYKRQEQSRAGRESSRREVRTCFYPRREHQH